jgi:MerR family transcriptional regulator, heat shock protein HspR
VDPDLRIRQLVWDRPPGEGVTIGAIRRGSNGGSTRPVGASPRRSAVLAVSVPSRGRDDRARARGAADPDPVKDGDNQGVCGDASGSARAAMCRAMNPTDDAHRPRHSVGQAAEMLNTRRRFLHRLDRYDVVRPRRTPGGHRRYTDHEIARVRRVIELAGEGMTLVAIRHILALEKRIRELEAQCDAAWDRVLGLDKRPLVPRMRRERVPPI